MVPLTMRVVELPTKAKVIPVKFTIFLMVHDSQYPAILPASGFESELKLVVEQDAPDATPLIVVPLGCPNYPTYVKK